MKNKKGFTLVELLAVIVVLAIIMIIAIPNVLNSMDTAKKNAIQVEARKALTYAMQKVQMDSLDPTAGAPKSCYTFDEIGMEAGGRYTGSVKYTAGAANPYVVYIWDGQQYAFLGKTNAEIKDANLTTATSAPSKLTTCGV